MKQIIFTKEKTVEVADREFPSEKLGNSVIGGKTLFSLVSAGTEINSLYLNAQHGNYPKIAGYAAVFEVDYVGSETSGFSVGDIAYCSGLHAAYQIANYRRAIKVPADVLPQEALFIRMAAVSMATLSRTAVRPCGHVLVTGLGAVGIMAMQAYNNCGYHVAGTDIDSKRVEVARKTTGLYADTKIDEEYAEKFELALECSGTQQATLECFRLLKKEGEISLVGVPWAKTGDIHGYEILSPIFTKFLKCYTGWEANLLMDLRVEHMKLAMKWLEEKKLTVNGLYAIYPYKDAQVVYDNIYNKTEKHLSVIFDWKESV